MGHEQDALAVRRPADDEVGLGMPREAPRHAAGGRHDVHVDVAVVFAGEGDLGAVGREMGIGLDAKQVDTGFSTAQSARHEYRLPCQT